MKKRIVPVVLLLLWASSWQKGDWKWLALSAPSPVPVPLLSHCPLFVCWSQKLSHDFTADLPENSRGIFSLPHEEMSSRLGSLGAFLERVQNPPELILSLPKSHEKCQAAAAWEALQTAPG